MLKKVVSIGMACAFLVGCFGAGEAFAALKTSDSESTEEETTAEVKTYSEDFTNWTTVKDSETLGIETTFDVLPEAYNLYPCDHPGTYEIVHYTTDVYEDGVTYDKWCGVYLPYGYDPEDTETKYNVLYFQHGHGGNPNVLAHKIKSIVPYSSLNIIDNLFDPEHGLMDSCIIITVTYYMESDETKYGTLRDAAAGDGRTGDLKNYFYKEVVEDIIPQVESRYNVYCEEFTDEGIIASRDHRAFSGYSRESACTWYMFHNAYEYFKYWFPMSCNTMFEKNGDDENWNASEMMEAMNNEQTVEYLTSAIDENPDLDFFIMCTAGGVEDAAAMKKQMAYFYERTDVFSYGTDPSVNNFYYTQSDFKHLDNYMPYSLYNVRDILFK